VTSSPFDNHPAPLPDGQWEFDESVAASFQAEAKTNIPDYERVIEHCLEIAEHSFDKDARVVDVGSALGMTLKCFYEQGYRDLHGVDSSQAMLNRAFNSPDHKIHYIHSSTFPEALVPVSLVTANWTLHFIRQRRAYIASIFNSLKVGGMLVLTDKVLASELVTQMYKNFKRRGGLSDAYIAYKEEALKEVLVCYSLEWYLATLREVGFRSVEIINTAYCFVSFLARK